VRRIREGFTLVEMLVVIGIIAILAGASMAGFSKAMRSAEKAKANEAVRSAATALAAIYESEGVWPKLIRTEGKTDGRLDKDVALLIAKRGYMSLSTLTDKDGNITKLSGKDRFGILTPWALKTVEASGTGASLATSVGTGGKVEDHILHFAVDLDGDGIIEGANVGGESVNIRAIAAVWSVGKSGGDKGKPWKYSEGLKKDDVYSWTKGQTQAVK